MAPHSSTLAWKTPWTEEPGGLQSGGREESDTTERLHFHFSLSCIGGGNGNPLQCSCLKNPRDRGAWWAAVSGVPQSRTRLKRLSSSSSSSMFSGEVSVQIFWSFFNWVGFYFWVLRVLFTFWMPVLYHIQVLQMQVILEQRRSELHSSTCTRVFSAAVCGWRKRGRRP